MQTGKTLFALALTIASGQIAWCGPHPELLKTVPAPASRPEIDLYVDRIAAGQHWAVALQPVDGLSGFAVNPGYVIPLEVSPGQSFEGEGNVGRLSASSYILADSEFHLNDLSSANESIYVEAQMAPGKTVSVYQAGALVFHGTVTAPLLLIDGKLGPASSAPRLKAISLLMLPPAIDDLLKPSLTPSATGSLEASTAMLKQHLSVLPATSVNLDSQTLDLAEGNVAVALVRIRIDKTGHVMSTDVLRGSGPLASAASKALSDATFRPFVQNGQLVAVDGVIRYSLSGKTLSTSLN